MYLKPHYFSEAKYVSENEMYRNVKFPLTFLEILENTSSIPIDQLKGEIINNNREFGIPFTFYILKKAHKYMIYFEPYYVNT